MRRTSGTRMREFPEFAAGYLKRTSYREKARQRAERHGVRNGESERKKPALALSFRRPKDRLFRTSRRLCRGAPREILYLANRNSHYYRFFYLNRKKLCKRMEY